MTIIELTRFQLDAQHRAELAYLRIAELEEHIARLKRYLSEMIDERNERRSDSDDGDSYVPSIAASIECDALQRHLDRVTSAVKA